MIKNELKMKWLHEEKRVFQGWDFSSIEDKMYEEALPWAYTKWVKKAIDETCMLLDMGTGGGEYLLSLNPTPGRTFATEKFKPNFDYAKDLLSKEGVELKFVSDDRLLPFDDETFDVIINRHESFDAKEVYRILKKDGLFISQQVGGMNTHEFATALLGFSPSCIDVKRSLASVSTELSQVGFELIKQEECFPKLRFYDVGAFVYFAKIIEWEFPTFSVEKYLEKLYELESDRIHNGYIEMMEHRFFIIGKK